MEKRLEVSETTIVENQVTDALLRWVLALLSKEYLTGNELNVIAEVVKAYLPTKTICMPLKAVHKSL